MNDNQIDDMTLSQKRTYIYGKLSGWSQIHNVLHEHIMATDIPRTQNANGMFLNLNALKEGDIQVIFDLCQQSDSYIATTEITLAQEPPKPPILQKQAKKPMLKKLPLTKTQKTLLSLM